MMMRWNGWGDSSVNYPLSEMAETYLQEKLGVLVSFPDVSKNSLLTQIPSSKISPHPLIQTTSSDRLYHSRGQSLPDWIALRYGNITTFPDGVVYPQNLEEVRETISFSYKNNICLIPYGGGTSVVGHINPTQNDNPILSVNMKNLNCLLELDKKSQLATIQTGTSGPLIEKQLNQQGYTLGHFPQSFEYSTLGGWIATRSSGQQSYHYGRIEDLFVGGHLETPVGSFSLPPHPASAAGPDLKQLVLGSEGRIGILTKAIVRVQPIPEVDVFYGAFFRNWNSGCDAVKSIVQNNIQISICRLSDPTETEITLLLSGKENQIKWLDRGLKTLNYHSDRCLLILGITGNRNKKRIIRHEVKSLIKNHSGIFVGRIIGNSWEKNRFKTPYLRNTLWDYGVAVDTLETAVPWKNVHKTVNEIKSAISNNLEFFNEKVLVFSHLSHIYRDGASIYTTFLFRRCKDPDELFIRWKKMKQGASKAIVSNGGTISHQHGVGTDHAPYLQEEKGELGIQTIKAICNEFDPKGLLNPGKLVM
ncbi:MAG: FAD-binding oxidoreductase [Candidatus Marinimicrobia bacterium]|nr:FAD-binding oxidoreductase [Candidatus Neomarinimicrobiota bacterium]